jgi:Zn finger protein HypA/HybF involved in hydrogenase expression
MTDTGSLHCDTCDATVAVDDARRRETYGGLDPDTWQTLCCPTCGSRLKTVFVGDE